MKRLLPLSILLFTLTLSSQNKASCKDFKTGVFKYSNPDYSEWTITRTNTMQVEVSSKTGFTIYSTIDWETDCEYTLTCKRIENSDLKIIGKKFKVNIIEVLNNSYKCISKSNDVQLEDLYLEMIKVK